MSVDGAEFLLFAGREFFYLLVPVSRERSWSGGRVGEVREGGKYFQGKSWLFGEKVLYLQTGGEDSESKMEFLFR